MKVEIMKKLSTIALCGAFLATSVTPRITAKTDTYTIFDYINSTEKVLSCVLTIGMVGFLGWSIKKSLIGSWKTYKKGTIKERLTSVAGNNEAKEQLNDIIEYLKNPEPYKKMGAKTPKGVLLEGPPGTGKTMLARALAGEANCTFITACGSDFEGPFVGSGRQNIRTLFRRARLYAPCIIFIDEIDTLIKKRGTVRWDDGQTLNAFLDEVDGFDKHKLPIIIVGATNRADMSDPAAVRPGRFDRIVRVGLPTMHDREKILQIHLQGKQHTSDINLTLLAHKTAGFSGAELANLINEAAIEAINKKQDSFGQAELEAVCNRVTATHIRTLSSFTETKWEIYLKGTIQDRFTSVAGNKAAKLELQDIVNYLQDPTPYLAIGAHMPKGILLEGPPGTGKTLLARALAGESNCSFINISGSSFVEGFVGSGATRIRELFQYAASLDSPCIIFIDEIDTLVANRAASMGRRGTEDTQTINELLTQMDGFGKPKHPIIVIGATNRADAIDPAVLRPGRFDRIVHIGLPTESEREEIIQLHLGTKKCAADINIAALATTTTNFSGAELANLTNEAAIMAINQGKTLVDQALLEAVLQKIKNNKKAAPTAYPEQNPQVFLKELEALLQQHVK